MQRFLLLTVAVVGMWSVAQAADQRLIGKVVQQTPALPGEPSLFYIGAEEKKYAFIEKFDEGYNFDVHATWFADRSEVLPVSREVLEPLVVGGYVPLRRGIKLVRQAAQPQIYVVEEGGVLREIAEPLLQELYGQAWSDHLVTMPDWVFMQYTLGRPYTERVHPDGTLFRYHNPARVYVLDHGQARSVRPQDMAANGFRTDAVVTIASTFTYPDGFSLDLDGHDEQLTTPAGPIKMFNRGDANNDGQIDIADPISMLGALFQAGPPPTCEDAWDANDDGELDISDAVALLLYLFGRFHSQPFHPGPGLLFGYDPTGDDLTCRAYRSELPQIEVHAATLLNRAVAPVTHDIELARFTFRSDLPEFPVPAVIIRQCQLKIEIFRSFGTTARPTDLTNLKLVASDGTVLAGPKNPVDNNPDGGGNPLGTVVFTDPWRLPATWSVRGDIGAAFRTGDVIRIFFRPASVRSTEAVLFGPVWPVGSAYLIGAETALTASVVLEPDRSVLAGTLDISVMQFSLGNPDSAETVKIVSVKLLVYLRGTPQDLSQWQLSSGNQILETSNLPILVALGNDAYDCRFDLTQPIGLAPGTAAVLTGNVTSSARTQGAIRCVLPEDVAVAVGVASGVAASISLKHRRGAEVAIVASHVPRVSYRYHPEARPLVAGGQTNVTVGNLQLEATTDAVRIETIELTGRRTVPSLRNGAWDQVKAITLYEGNRVAAQTLVISDDPDGDVESRRAILDVSPPIVVLPGLPSLLRVAVVTTNVSQYPNQQPAKPGQGFQLFIADASHVHAVAIASGIRLAVDVRDAVLPVTTVFRTVPQVWLNDELDHEGVADYHGAGLAISLPLYRLRIMADQAADIGIRQLTFLVRSREGVNLRDFWMQDGHHQGCVARAELVSGGQAPDGTNHAIYRFVMNDPQAAGQPAAYPIPAGQSATFTVRADSVCWRCCESKPTTFTSIELLGDTQFPTEYPTAAASMPAPCLGCPISGNFVWTDWSSSGPLQSFDRDYLNRPQWMNGAAVATAESLLPAQSKPVIIHSCE